MTVTVRLVLGTPALGKASEVVRTEVDADGVPPDGVPQTGPQTGHTRVPAPPPLPGALARSDKEINN